jgi:hypothetical protein
MFAGKSFVFNLEIPGNILTVPGADSIRGSKAYCHHSLSELMEETSRSRLFRSSP